MNSFLHRQGWLIWTAALTLALAFLAVDSGARLDAIRRLYSLTAHGQPLPAAVPSSSTGYAGQQHRLILPASGTDGYQWIMQTEQMLAGDRLRIRHTQSDNPPDGRAVHWSSSVRWWLAAVAKGYQRFHPELSTPQALERVAPWANTAAAVFFLILFTPLIAWRLGPLAGTLFPLGLVSTYPLYESFMIGSLDHHGFAALSCFAAVILLVCGGGGWIRDRALKTETMSEGDRSSLNWLPSRHAASYWFVASALVAGIGIWISAATMAPVIAAIGLGALISLAPARSPTAIAQVRLHPNLWRLWGLTGCATSLGFYLLEYFPWEFATRLEVNHPLYAIAWLAMGDLVCRLLQPETISGRWHWLALDALGIGLLPTVILLSPETFRVTDPFLWRLHADYIVEFQSLMSQLMTLSPWLISQNVSLLPLLVLPMVWLLWPGTLPGIPKIAWRAWLVVATSVGVTFLHAILFPGVRASISQLASLPESGAGPLAHVLCLLLDLLVLLALFWRVNRREALLVLPNRSVLMLTLIPALVTLGLSLRQVRWFGAASAVLLAMLVASVSMLEPQRGAVSWPRRRRLVTILALVLILLPFPLFTMFFPVRLGYPALLDVPQIITRDVSYMLRARLGNRRGAVVSGPTTTTWMSWFGGVQGLGTLYWENLEGLKASAAIYGAHSAEQAKALIDRHGITHLVVFSWDPFVREYARLARGRRFDPRDPLAVPDDAFMLRLLQQKTKPTWLHRIPYRLPELPVLENAEVWIFEVVRSTDLS